MSPAVDIGTKHLISLAPEQWARWLTNDDALQSLELPSGEFTWVGRTTDALFKAHSPQHGTFLIVNEVQYRPDARMPVRLRAYAALAEERYGLPVFAVVVNVLHPDRTMEIVSNYHREFMGQMAHQDYRVINLWEIDARPVLARKWTSLLPFVPIMRGGEDPDLVQQALVQLRADERLADLEELLGIFASFVMSDEQVQQMMRWDMTVIRESPWFKEIEQEAIERGMEQGLQQGMEQGLQQGQAEVLLLLLERRFGTVPVDVRNAIANLSKPQVVRALDAALTAESVTDVARILETPSSGTESGQAPAAPGCA